MKGKGVNLNSVDEIQTLYKENHLMKMDYDDREQAIQTQLNRLRALIEKQVVRQSQLKSQIATLQKANSELVGQLNHWQMEQNRQESRSLSSNPIPRIQTPKSRQSLKTKRSPLTQLQIKLP